MDKIFRLKYEKFHSKYLLQGGSTHLFAIRQIQDFYNSYVPNNLILLRKLPLHELKTVVKIECPFDKIDIEDHGIIIQSSKKIRYLLNINERNTCIRCTKRNNCKFFESQPFDLKKENYGLIDLNLIMFGLYKLTKSTSANFQTTELISRKENLTEKNDLLKKIQMKDWNSAITILEGINDSIEDIVENGGKLYRILLESMKTPETQVIDENPNDINNKEIKDKLEELMINLKNCKNRKEKRILLAKFNSKYKDNLINDEETYFKLNEMKEIENKEQFDFDVNRVKIQIVDKKARRIKRKIDTELSNEFL